MYTKATMYSDNRTTIKVHRETIHPDITQYTNDHEYEGNNDEPTTLRQRSIVCVAGEFSWGWVGRRVGDSGGVGDRGKGENVCR